MTRGLKTLFRGLASGGAFLFILCGTGCDPEEPCSLTIYPLSQDNLSVPEEVFFRAQASVRLDFAPGDCGSNQVDWQYSGEAVITNAANPWTSTEYITSGEQCVQIVAETQSSDWYCQEVTVRRNQTWGLYHADFPEGRSKQSVTFTLRGDVYSGFGNTNAWYRFDTATFAWEPRAAIPNLVDFTAYAGFVLGDYGYLVGNNSKYYRYDPAADSWTDLGSFPENVVNFLELGNFANYEEYAYPIVGLSDGEYGYFGLGRNQTWYRYDASSNTWSPMPDRPEDARIGDHTFAYQGKIYQGKWMFETATQTWLRSPENFNVDQGFSPGFVEFRGVMYGGHQLVTVTFDGDNITPVPITQPHPYTRIVGGLFGHGAATGNFIIFPRQMGGIGGDEASVRYYVHQ